MEENNEIISSKPRLGWLKICLIGMAGYLLGSFIPAGYVRYFIQSQLFPETLGSQKPVFDRAKLEGAIKVTPSELTDTLDANPALFQQKFMEKPVKLTGQIKYFLTGSMSSDGLVLTLDTGADYETGIIMTFDDPKSAGVVALREGGSVNATCMVSGISSDNAHLGHCEITK